MGNVYMEAEEIRYKNATYPNVSLALDKALEGGGGGGTTVVANPEGSATADLSKLQVGTTIYGIPAEAGDISYDNTLSGMTADDVQEAIDELNTGLSGVTELIPSGATASNKLATMSDIPEDVYFDTTAALSTSGTTTVTFTESEILATSVVDIAISVWGIVPDDVVVSAGSCVITMPQVETAVTVSIRLYVK